MQIGLVWRKSIELYGRQPVERVLLDRRLLPVNLPAEILILHQHWIASTDTYHILMGTVKRTHYFLEMFKPPLKLSKNKLWQKCYASRKSYNSSYSMYVSGWTKGTLLRTDLVWQ